MKTKITIIDQILEVAQPLLDELVIRELERLRKKLEKDNQELLRAEARDPKNYHYSQAREYKDGMFDHLLKHYREGLTWDLVKSLAKYCQAGDILIGEPWLSREMGVIVIGCRVNRDGVEYNYETQVISAGGYNIQCFHYRYLTHTTLPKAPDPTAWIKKLTKEQKLEQEIEGYQKRIENAQNKIKELDLMSHQEIALMEYNTFLHSTKVTTLPSYYTQEDIEKKVKFAYSNPKSEIENCTKYIKQTQAKLEKLNQN